MRHPWCRRVPNLLCRTPQVGGLCSVCQGKAKWGVDAFAHALLIILKILAANSGHGAQDSLAAMWDEGKQGNTVGLDLNTGYLMDPIQRGVYDSYRALQSCITSSTGIASNLLLRRGVKGPTDGQVGWAC